jgi:hypothetical protein
VRPLEANPETVKKLVTSAAAPRVPGAVCSTAAPAALLGGNAGAPTRACGAVNSNAAPNSVPRIAVCMGMVQFGRTGTEGTTTFKMEARGTRGHTGKSACRTTRSAQCTS